AALPAMATPGGGLLVLAIAIPAVGVLLSFAFGSRVAERLAFAVVAIVLALSVAIAVQLAESNAPLVYLLGGWRPPLGVALRADGLSAVMMLMASVVMLAVAVFARADFATPSGTADARAPLVFWTMLMAILGALNVVVLSGDLFTLYVALELLTFAAVPLVCLDGRAETLRAALRYMLFALAGSLFYLAGTALFYGAYGTLDIALIARDARADSPTVVAAAIMTAGLLAKTALFPLHLWLPPAHAGAPAAASAVLSALVVKGSWFIVLRLWLDAVPTVISPAAAQCLGALGAAAIVFGSVVAIQQARLKLMVAYSTVAQLGYLFLLFPLALGTESLLSASGPAITGGLLQVVSHATAKAAMFMAAGLVYVALGHDRVKDLGGIAHALPMSVAAFTLGGIALIGLPPAGGFVAKWLLLGSALASGQWWWAVVLVVGGLLTACYVFPLLARAVSSDVQPKIVRAVPRSQEAAVLALAIVSTLLGLAALLPFDLVQVGRPAIAGGMR
ncbi:MAG: proton-conducting transporter membrane subunit, partial [Burkholderiales bacterium]